MGTNTIEVEEFYKIESTYESKCIYKKDKCSFQKEEAEFIFYNLLTEEQQKEFVIARQEQ